MKRATEPELVLTIYKDGNGYFATLPPGKGLQESCTFYIPTESAEWLLRGIENLETSFAIRSIEPYQVKADGAE